MEIVKREVRMRKPDIWTDAQFTLDDDYIVPDTKPAVGKVIRETGYVKVDQVRVMTGNVKVEGHLEFLVLYTSPGEEMAYSLAGMIPFNEVFSVKGATEGELANVSLEIEDLRVEAVNPFKLNVRAVIDGNISIDKTLIKEIATDIRAMESVDIIKKRVETVNCVQSYRDKIRVKKIVNISASKPPVYKIIWIDKWIKNISETVYSGAVDVSGELVIFVLYMPEEDNIPMQWGSFEIPFSETIEIKDANEKMIPDVKVSIGSLDANVEGDENGEQRQLGFEAVLDVEINMYEEEEIEILKDVYTPYKELKMQTADAEFEKLVVKNSAQIKAEGIVKCDSADIMQIINSSGNSKIYDITQKKDKILVEGVLSVSVLYISSSDNQPVGVCRGSIPISKEIEALGIEENSRYRINQRVEQISASILPGGEIDIKATVIIDLLVLDEIHENVITDIEENAIDLNIIRDLPAFVFYVVKEGDSLWSIAKNNYVTVEEIKKTNNLESDEIMPGDRILIVKQVY